MQNHLATVIAALERHSQRATYGAVGGVVGLPARSVMKGQSKSHRNSWVVAAKGGEPTGYTHEECSPQLKAHSNVIKSSEALAAWLKAYP